MPTAANDQDLSALEALDRLVSDFDGTGDLERLEDSLREFNLFEALGAVNSELRHSTFLAWLFDPHGSHGFGDVIAKRLLQRILIHGVPTAKLSAVNLDLMDFADIEVRREWKSIDILLLSPANHLVVVIENKVGATESTDQLQRYRKLIQTEFPPEQIGGDWRHVFIFLTIDGVAPTDDSYVTLSYRQLVELLEATLRNRGGSVLREVAMAVAHYVQMLRRNHMEDSELIALARRIYAKHKAALDFIFESRPDGWIETRTQLLNLFSQHKESLVVDRSTERTIWIRFYPHAWDRWEHHLSQGSGWKWAGSDQFMLCEVKPDKDRERARVEVVLGQSNNDERQRMITALSEVKAFEGKHGAKWTTLIRTPWRPLEKEGEYDPEENARVLFADITKFLEQESPTIERAMERAFGTGTVAIDGSVAPRQDAVEAGLDRG